MPHIGECPKCHGLMELTRHHILPRSKGGTDDPENILLVCRPCHDELDRAAGVRPKRKRMLPRRFNRDGVCPCGNLIGKYRTAVGATLCRRCEFVKERVVS